MKETNQLSNDALLSLDNASQFLDPFHFQAVFLLQQIVLFYHVHLFLLEDTHDVPSFQHEEIDSCLASYLTYSAKLNFMLSLRLLKSLAKLVKSLKLLPFLC